MWLAGFLLMLDGPDDAAELRRCLVIARPPDVRCLVFQSCGAAPTYLQAKWLLKSSAIAWFGSKATADDFNSRVSVLQMRLYDNCFSIPQASTS